MKSFFSLSMLLLVTVVFGQVEVQKDSITQLEEVLLVATRTKDKSPFTVSTLDKKTITSQNLGQDLPILMDMMPSVVTTSDAGAGVGYTGIRVRGSDATRVNVTLNGIPYNDAESQGTYWVDLPDFTSSVDDIQLQRGVGTSTNGSAAFGASLSLKTLEPSKKGYAKTTHSYGSFNTHKHNISLGSGIHKGFYAEGRLSQINSDGYIDRAFSDLSSYYTEAGFKNESTIIKALVFGGHERTYQSWYGTPEAVINNDQEGIEAFIARNYPSDAVAENLRTAGRTYNHYLYENQIDNYSQDHYQLHLSHKFNPHLSSSVSFNYTHGKGYYEQFKDDEKISDYFNINSTDDAEGDVVRRRWLDNDFYALVYALNYKKDKIAVSFGGGYNEYKGLHFGKLIWDSFPSEIEKDKEYYNNIGEKKDFNTYAKGTYTINSKLSVFADAQVRVVTYNANGISSDLLPIQVAEEFVFVNPKAGLNYNISAYSNAYASIAIANREPNRDDLVKNPVLPKAEQLIDWEAGYRFRNKTYFGSANLYYMDYNNQLVLTGAIDDVGDPIRQNVAKSYRAGLELQGGVKLNKTLKFEGNLSLSQNKIKDYTQLVYDTQYDPETWETVYQGVVSTDFTNTNISFSPSLVAASRLTYTPIANLDIAILSKYVGKQYLDNTSNESKIIKSYFINHLNASYTVKPSWIESVSFNLLVNNIFDEQYESNGYTYSYYYRPDATSNAITEKFYYPQAGINFLTGVSLTF